MCKPTIVLSPKEVVQAADPTNWTVHDEGLIELSELLGFTYQIATPGTPENLAVMEHMAEFSPLFESWVSSGIGRVAILSKVLTGALHPMLPEENLYYTTILEMQSLTGWTAIQERGGHDKTSWFRCERCGAKCQTFPHTDGTGCVMCEDDPDDEFPYYECDCDMAGGPMPWVTCPIHVAQWHSLPVGSSYSIMLPVDRMATYTEEVDWKEGERARKRRSEKWKAAAGYNRYGNSPKPNVSKNQAKRIAKLMGVKTSFEPDDDPVQSFGG